MENNNSITTAEWKALISEVYAEAYQAVVDSGSRHGETESTLTATGAASYAAPATLLSLIGVDFVVDSAGRRRCLSELMVQERNRLLGTTGEASYYQLSGGNITLYPNPSSGSYRIVFVAQPADLGSAADGDSIETWCPAGERFIVWGAAGLGQHKGELNQIRAVQQQERALVDLQYWAANVSPRNSRRRMVDDDPTSLLDIYPDPDGWLR